MAKLESPYLFLTKLVDKNVALCDRGFVVTEGRLVYPTVVGKLVACNEKVVWIEVAKGEEPTAFFLDALRSIRELPTEQGKA